MKLARGQCIVSSIYLCFALCTCFSACSAAQGLIKYCLWISIAVIKSFLRNYYYSSRSVDTLINLLESVRKHVTILRNTIKTFSARRDINRLWFSTCIGTCLVKIASLSLCCYKAGTDEVFLILEFSRNLFENLEI